jgi:hypothetical protein
MAPMLLGKMPSSPGARSWVALAIELNGHQSKLEIV